MLGGVVKVMSSNPTLRENYVYWDIWFGLMLNVPVNSYGHVRTVSSHNHTFLPGQA